MQAEKSCGNNLLLRSEMLARKRLSIRKVGFTEWLGKTPELHVFQVPVFHLNIIVAFPKG